MGTEVLRPQTVLAAHRTTPVFPRRKPNPTPVTNPNHHNAKPGKKPPPPAAAAGNRPEARKRREGSPKPAKAAAVPTAPVAILKRGEPLDALKKPAVEMNRAKAAAKQVRARAEEKTRADVVYAGSVCSVSPAPSAVPLPSFAFRREASPEPEVSLSSSPEDSAASYLRRVLRLEP